MLQLPTGTVTFLFTDIEGSTSRWEQQTQAMQAALARHDALVRDAILAHRGAVVKTTGDGFHAAFSTALDAVAAALDAQRALNDANWDDVGAVRVRMALHTGVAEERDGDYYGPTLNRAGRLMAVGHGGQVLLSLATQELVRDLLPPGVEMRDLGEHRLKDLIRPERIFQLRTPDLPHEFPPIRTLDRTRHNLPVSRDTLIGREREVAEVAALLRRTDVGLVTLTGPGGAGKTRLSLQVAAEILDEFPDGVWFVELAALADASLVIPTAARILGVPEASGQPLDQVVADHLRDKQMLLVLDNFEQVVAAAPHLQDLLDTAARLKLLVSSRAVLHLSGEKEYLVPPLALPPGLEGPGDGGRRHAGYAPLSPETLGQYAASALFIQRAQAVRPDFVVTTENAPAIAEICARLDGLPLAIELAAARIKLLAPQAMLPRLNQRLRLLTGGQRDRTPRQQTLRGAIDWSYNLLDVAEQQLFARLGVFMGGATIEAVEHICLAGGDLPLDVFDGIQSLVDKSLLQQSELSDGESHFGMFETIREYAREQLETVGLTDAMHRAHADYYLALAETAERSLAGREQQLWLTQLDREHDNLRGALTWATGQTGDTSAIGLRMARALWRFWEIRGYFTEGRRWLDAALVAAPDASPSLRAPVLDGAGVLARYQGDYDQAAALHQEAFDLLQSSQDLWARVTTLGNLAAVAHDQGDYARAEASYQLALAAVANTPPGTAAAAHVLGQVHNGLGKTYREQGRLEDAGRCSQEALTLSRRHGNLQDEAQALNSLGVLAAYQRHYAVAERYHHQALDIRRVLGDQPGEGSSLSNLGHVTQELGDYGRSEEYLAAALAIQQALGNRREEINVRLGLGAMYHQLGKFDEATTSLELGLQLCHEIGDNAGEAFILANLGVVKRDLGLLADAEQLLRDSLTIARRLADQTVISYCLSYLGSVVLQHGRPGDAREYAEAALVLRRQIGLNLWTTADLATLAAAHLTQGETDRARTYAREAIEMLWKHPDDEPEYPHHDFLVCSRVLAAVNVPDEARAALQTAYERLMSRAEKILDRDLRHSFLFHVPLNRKIVAETEAVLGVPPMP